MPSDRTAAANRENAQASTGPRTTVGKQRASQNARKHGLANASMDRSATADAERLVDAIAVDFGDHPVLQQAAQVVAEAEIHLRRVLAVKASLVRGSQMAEHTQGEGAKVSSPKTWTDLLQGLQGLERYERRALSRRKSAVRRFEKLASGLPHPSKKRVPE